MVHPQHVVEVVLLRVILNEKIHLENPRAELQLQARTPTAGPRDGEAATGTSSAAPQGRGCEERREARGQAAPLTPTHQTHADHPSMVTGVPVHVQTWQAKPHPQGGDMRAHRDPHTYAHR